MPFGGLTDLAARRLLTLALVAFLPACGATVTSETTFEVQDPSRVAVLRGAEVVLPAGGAATETEVGKAEVEPAPGGHAQVDVTAVRAASGAISFRWDTRLPLVTGEEQTMFPVASATGRRVPLRRTVDLTRPAFQWDVCASLVPRGSAYAAVVAMRPCGPDDLGGNALTIDTPWSNVVLTRRTTIVPRTRRSLQTASAIFAAPLLLLTTGANYGSASLAVLEVTGVSLGVSGLLLGTSMFFPGPRTCERILGPDPQRLQAYTGTRAKGGSHGASLPGCESELAGRRRVRELEWRRLAGAR